MQAFSSCSEWGLLFVAVHGFLIAVASLAVLVVNTYIFLHSDDFITQIENVSQHKALFLQLFS